MLPEPQEGKRRIFMSRPNDNVDRPNELRTSFGPEVEEEHC